jgi:hypothetical protein
MDEPLYIVRNTALRWLTMTNYDLLIRETALASARGLHVKSELTEARIDAAVYGKGNFAERGARLHAREEQRIAEVAVLSDAELLARAADNIVVPVEAITAARVSRRLGLCKLAATLDDGRRVTWRWMNRYGPYEEVEPVLRRVLGSRLTSRR